MSVLTGALLAGSALLAPAAHAQQSAPTGASTTVAATHTVQYLSNDDFVREYGAQKASAFGIPLPGETESTVIPMDPPQPWYKIDWTTKDWDGRNIPTRHGTDDFGFVHACNDHSMCAEAPMTAPYHGYPDKWTSSTRAEYYGVALIDGEPELKITTVAEFGHVGPNGAEAPDGKVIGTITSYCQGMTYCPYWING